MYVSTQNQKKNKRAEQTKTETTTCIRACCSGRKIVTPDTVQFLNFAICVFIYYFFSLIRLLFASKGVVDIITIIINTH